MKFLKGKNIYLAPKNNFTIVFNEELKNIGIVSKGYFDNYKKDRDIVDKISFTKDDLIVVFSPNHWKEIASSVNTKNIYILNVVNDKFILKKVDEFKGYEIIPALNFNRFSLQKYHWDNHLKTFYEGNQDIEQYGYEWGDPENEFDLLGNYLSINKKLNSLINSTTKILEIGTLGGKWTKYMLDADKIICVDINKYFIDVVSNRFAFHINKFDFYISSGNELNGIKTNSVDIVFCMDTLVRVEKQYIFDYIEEIYRILKKDGTAIIHLPNSDITDCRNRKFTDLNTNEIINEFEKYFNNFRLDSKTIVHGTLVYIGC